MSQVLLAHFTSGGLDVPVQQLGFKILSGRWNCPFEVVLFFTCGLSNDLTFAGSVRKCTLMGSAEILA